MPVREEKSETPTEVRDAIVVRTVRPPGTTIGRSGISYSKNISYNVFLIEMVSCPPPDALEGIRVHPGTFEAGIEFTGLLI